jgi:hypothetical protein
MVTSFGPSVMCVDVNEKESTKIREKEEDDG